ATSIRVGSAVMPWTVGHVLNVVVTAAAPFWTRSVKLTAAVRPRALVALKVSVKVPVSSGAVHTVAAEDEDANAPPSADHSKLSAPSPSLRATAATRTSSPGATRFAEAVKDSMTGAMSQNGSGGSVC